MLIRRCWEWLKLCSLMDALTCVLHGVDEPNIVSIIDT